MNAPTIAQDTPAAMYPGLGVPNVWGRLYVERGPALAAARIIAEAAAADTALLFQPGGKIRRNPPGTDHGH